MAQTTRPASRRDFEIAIICALTIEADAVEALFDRHWDDEGPSYGKAARDANAYSTGLIGPHNIVLAHMPDMGKANAAAVAANCRTSFHNIKLALVVGICGATPRADGEDIVLGDVIISEGVIQYDLGRQFPERFVRKNTLGGSSSEIRSLLAKLKGVRGRMKLSNKMTSSLDTLQGQPALKAQYPGVEYDRLFEAAYRHLSDGKLCEDCGCSGTLVSRPRLAQTIPPQPVVHFGLIASGDTVMKSGLSRDRIAQQEGAIGFEMEGAGVWNTFPCVIIKGACDYADSHKMKAWQRYAAATAAACSAAFLEFWEPAGPPHIDNANTSGKDQSSTGPWFLVPFPKNNGFIGRDPILKTLQQQLMGPLYSRASLFGLGGIGKTQIALAYVYWLHETSPDVSIFWVNASSAEQLRQSFSVIARDCQVPNCNDPKVDVLPMVKKWLESKDCGRWLMIIDNADDMELFSEGSGPGTRTLASDADFARTLPECGHGNILVTTRNKQVGVDLTLGQPSIKVDRMDENESEHLLQTRLGDESFSHTDLSNLSTKLDHVPLALTQAAAYIEKNSIQVSKYLQLLDEGDQSFIKLLGKNFETVGRYPEIPSAITQTWMLSFRMIQRQNPFAAELLSLMSFLDRQAIPEAFLSSYGERNGRTDLLEAVGVLKAFSLVSEDNDDNLNMHRLVHLVTRKWLTEEGTADHYASQALLAVAEVYPFGVFENREKCSAYLPHASAVLEGAIGMSRAEAEWKAYLLHNTAEFFSFKGKYRDSARLSEECLEIYKEVFGNKHPKTLQSMNNLALTFRGQGRWDEAEALQVEVLESQKRMLGDEHPETLRSMDNLASTFGEQGRWDEAEALQVEVLESQKRMLGDEHPETLRSMHNLASTFWRQGRWDEAEVLYVEVLESRKRLLGDKHPDTLGSMHNLASTFGEQGRWDEAEVLYVEVLESRKRLLGDKHPDTLGSMHNLALTFGEQGRWDEAEVLYVEVLESRKRMSGDEHPETLRSMHNLASTFWKQRRWDEAEVLYVEVLESRKRLLGDKHPDTLGSIQNLALMQEQRKKSDEKALAGDS
ncbi:hypothetical protein EDB80DRAFT_652516 [Ilyonectria destructans]|nr:hypothetical protein EDB80DRAFT_652516 [Ilyonectria destructans]